MLASLENHDGLNDEVRIVVNRSGLEKTQISTQKAEETIDREIFWRIPNNYSVISECRNNGVPLLQQAPKAAITHSIAELADKLCGGAEANPAPTTKKEKKAWLPFLGK